MFAQKRYVISSKTSHLPKQCSTRYLVYNGNKLHKLMVYSVSNGLLSIRLFPNKATT